MTIKRLSTLLPIAVLLIFSLPTKADESRPLQKGDLLAICGDSITEQTLYSVFIEEYLLACRPMGIDKIRALQAGWEAKRLRLPRPHDL